MGIIERKRSMAYYITNGFYFVKLKKTGGIKKTVELIEATLFNERAEAEKILKKAPAKTKRYTIISMECLKGENVIFAGDKAGKRKKFTPSMRRMVYAKDHGCCYICGKPVLPACFEIEHKIPLSKGGTNDISNLYTACHICNTMKNSMSFEDFLHKASEIVYYQLDKIDKR